MVTLPGAFSVLDGAGRELFESGTLAFLDDAMTYADLQLRMA